MLYLLWGLINLALIIGFLILCSKAISLLKNNTGKPAALLFAVGILSFVTVPDSKSKRTFVNLSLPKTPSANNSSSDITEPLHVVLQDNLVSDFTFDIFYKRKSPDFINEPSEAYSGVNGMVSGINWIPEQYIVEKTTGNKEFSYFVSGSVEWKILRYTVFTQFKRFKGRVAIK